MSKDYSHYRDYIDLRGDGRVVLYKRADHENPKWTVRLSIPNTQGFIVKSCKTRNDYEARRFAEDLYYELEGRARRNEPLVAPTFEKVFLTWSKFVEAENRIRSPKYVNSKVRRIELWALRYLRDYKIDLVTDSVLADYSEWRITQTPKPPALATLRNERNALNQLLRFARRKGYIRDIPTLEIKAARNIARPDIPEAEWWNLCNFLPTYLASAVDKRRRRERFYLKQYTLILGNTGIRVGEARRLQ